VYIYTVRPKNIFFYFDDDGNPTPMPGYILAERIYKKAKTSALLLTDLSDEKENNRVVVTNIANNVTDGSFKKGDIVIIETMADYEVVYADKGRENRLIRVKEEDIIAVDHGYELTENHKTGV
jgi:co-chaperonin GroES (HSP10)